jgi:hypothetical protein
MNMPRPKRKTLSQSSRLDAGNLLWAIRADTAADFFM